MCTIKEHKRILFSALAALEESDRHIAALYALSMIWQISDPKQKPYSQVEPYLYDHANFQLQLLMPYNNDRKVYIENLADALKVDVETLTSYEILFSRFTKSYWHITRQQELEWGFLSNGEVRKRQRPQKNPKRGNARRRNLEKIDGEKDNWQDQDEWIAERRFAERVALNLRGCLNCMSSSNNSSSMRGSVFR